MKVGHLISDFSGSRNTMHLLAEIHDASVGLSEQGEQLGANYTLRKSARAIVVNEAGEMAAQYLHTYGYHKLPGGGVDPGEAIAAALEREVREEVGCACNVGALLGVTIEYRNEQQLLHISYGFVATVVGEVGTPALEPGEIEEGQETFWLPPAEVFKKMQHDVPTHYQGHFILAREQAFLTAYLLQADNSTT